MGKINLKNIASDVASEVAAPFNGKSKLTISFAGKYAALYDAIVKAAADEDRDPDFVVLRVLSASYLGQPAPVVEVPPAA